MEEENLKESVRKNMKCCRFCKYYIPEIKRIEDCGFFFTETFIPSKCDYCRDFINFDRIPCADARRLDRFCGQDARFYEEVLNPVEVIPEKLQNGYFSKLRNDKQRCKHKHWWNFFFN